MASAFARSIRTLEADTFRRMRAVAFVGVLLAAAWTYWAFRVPISLFEVSSHARLESERAAYPIQSPAAGRIILNRLDRGREVQQGEVLLELDTQAEKLAIREQEVKLAAIPRQLEELYAQMRAEETAREVEGQSSEVAISEARERIRQQEAAARYAKAEAARMSDLRKEGLAAHRDAEKAESEARKLDSAVVSAAIVVNRLAKEQQARDSERAVRIRTITASIAQLEGARRAAEALLQSLQYRVEQRLIRAPVFGAIGEAATLQRGAVVTEGQVLGVIVPSGQLKIVAHFPPAAAVSRIHNGQRARMRLDGYPSVEYGAVQASVTRVATEIRDGLVRVDLAVLDSSGWKIPLRHAMPGTVEVEVERIPPAALLLRSVGQNLAAPLRVSIEGPR